MPRAISVAVRATRLPASSFVSPWRTDSCRAGSPVAARRFDRESIGFPFQSPTRIPEHLTTVGGTQRALRGGEVSNVARPIVPIDRRVGLAELEALGPNEPSPVATVALRIERRVAATESVQLLDGGDTAYPRMLAAISRARRSVHLEVYAFSPWGVGAKFLEVLAQAVSRGVVVVVLIDGWGSARGGRAVVAALREAGCAARIHNRLRGLLVGRFGRNHRKILLVDDEVAFVGGINIGDENVGEGVRLGWADLALEIRGPQCARLGHMVRREPYPSIDSSLSLFLCGLGGGWRLRRRYLVAFRTARQRIHIAHGYFIPDRGVVRAITAAARRGIQVRLLLAGRSDVPFARAASRRLYCRLLAAGVRIHEWNGSVLHAKVATVDGSRLLLGSFNLDPFSLANLEALVEVDDALVVEQAESWIQDHFARSRSITSLEASSRLQRWLLDPLGLLVARLADAISRVIASRRQRRRTTGVRRFGAAARSRSDAPVSS